MDSPDVSDLGDGVAKGDPDFVSNLYVAHSFKRG